MRKALTRPEPIGAVEQVTSKNILRPGHARGRLVGGNLSSLQVLLGTSYEPEWAGRILFWEDIFEEPHNLDTKLMHMRTVGVFDKIAGMIVGTLVECEEREFDGVPSVAEIVLHHAKGYEFPILHEVNIGHTRDKLTIPLGVMASIDSTDMPLAILEAGVD